VESLVTNIVTDVLIPFPIITQRSKGEHNLKQKAITAHDGTANTLENYITMQRIYRMDVKEI